MQFKSGGFGENQENQGFPASCNHPIIGYLGFAESPVEKLLLRLYFFTTIYFRPHDTIFCIHVKSYAITGEKKSEY